MWVGIAHRRRGRSSAPAPTSRRSPPARPASCRPKRGGFGGIARRERTKPIIAAVDGPALAGGCEIVAGLRPHRRLDAAALRHPRGEALAGRRRRRPVPPAPRAPPQHRHGARPHRRPDHRRAGLRPRPGQRAVEPGEALARPPWPWPSGSAPTRRSPCARAARSCVDGADEPTTRSAVEDERRAGHGQARARTEDFGEGLAPSSRSARPQWKGR